MVRWTAPLAVAVMVASGLPLTAAAVPAAPVPTVDVAAAHDTSPPLRDLVAAAAAARVASVASSATTTSGRTPIPLKPNPRTRIDALLATNPGPPVIPDPTGPIGDAEMPALGAGFEGIKNEDQPDPNFRYYPPDTDGDVGPNHYVQVVNSMFAVFDKSGSVLLGPANNNTIWAGLGGACQTDNDGDPIVQYDQFADRWLISQFAVSSGMGSGPYFECVAVSATPDPTGAYHRYAFQYAEFPDYPKFGVWPDGYYVTYNMFGTDANTFSGFRACALERSVMLAGGPARQTCFDLAEEWSLLPSDNDGPTPAPAGSPNYLLGEDYDEQDKLTMYKFHVDWVTPASSTLTGPITVGVHAFTWACLDRSVTRTRCIPQRDTDVLLESLGGRTMYRLAYRNYGTHESLLTNHTVAMDGNLALTAQTGVAWYELRSLTDPTPTVHQQGTSADPDGTTFRFMASMAMDRQGNMALGYSTSSTTHHPGIRYVGRLADDPPNTMPQAEATIMDGTGSQEGVAARWGDYSSMQVDPVDDCTFWYTNEYLTTTSELNWHTRIASFTFPSCQRPGAPSPVTAAAGNGSAVVTWTAPTDVGTAPVEGYTVTAAPGGSSCTTTIDTTCTILGLDNGTAYSITVQAANSHGLGAASVPVTVTPVGSPYAPTGVVAAGGDGVASVAWVAPRFSGAAVTGYTATATPGGATCSTPVGADPAPTSCTVPGLVNGTAYTFTVTATNAAGTGPASTPSAPVTPLAPPAPPVLSIATASLVTPGAGFPVAIAGAIPGCVVDVVMSTATVSTRADAVGTGTVVVTAPQPNGPYAVTATQSGTGCTTQSASQAVTVAGAYITGPTSAKARKSVKHYGREFTPKKSVKWRVTLKGKKVRSTKSTASSKGTATLKSTFSKKGTYEIRATQGTLVATYTVKVK